MYIFDYKLIHNLTINWILIELKSFRFNITILQQTWDTLEAYSPKTKHPVIFNCPKTQIEISPWLLINSKPKYKNTLWSLIPPKPSKD